MKTPLDSQQQKHTNYRDHQRFENAIDTYEPKDHLHPSYRHWGCLPRPRSGLMQK